MNRLPLFAALAAGFVRLQKNNIRYVLHGSDLYYNCLITNLI